MIENKFSTPLPLIILNKFIIKMRWHAKKKKKEEEDFMNINIKYIYRVRFKLQYIIGINFY